MTDLPVASGPPIANAFRCSDAARSRGDQLSGTAPPAIRWLLVEYPGPWAPDALAGSRIDAGVRRQLQRACAEAGARLLLIRRPGRRGSIRPDRRLWAVLGRGSAAVLGDWSGDDDLLAAARALAEPPPEPAQGSESPMILVCAHGVHDVCCAVRGRPVARALAERWPEQTWECSHVGGDRFAPNVVLLPDGAYYGDLDPDSAIEVVSDHLAGRVRPDFLRGFSGYAPPVQAAMNALLTRLDPADARRLRYRDHENLGPDTWRVRFELGASSAVVELSAARTEPTRLTCRAARSGVAVDYRVREIAGIS